MNLPKTRYNRTLIKPENSCGRIDDINILNFIITELEAYSLNLTDTEQKVLFLVLKGYSTEKIMIRFGRSRRTIENQISYMEKKLENIFSRKVDKLNVFGAAVNLMKKKGNRSYINYFHLS